MKIYVKRLAEFEGLRRRSVWYSDGYIGLGTLYGVGYTNTL